MPRAGALPPETDERLVGRGSLPLPPEPINIARGEIVDEETLVASEPLLARNEGRIPDVDARLPLMLPVVVYKGAAPWKAAREVNELVEPAEGTLASYRPSQRYRVLDERNAGEDDFPRRNLGSALVRLERIRSPSDLAAVQSAIPANKRENRNTDFQFSRFHHPRARQATSCDHRRLDPERRTPYRPPEEAPSRQPPPTSTDSAPLPASSKSAVAASRARPLNRDRPKSRLLAPLPLPVAWPGLTAPVGTAAREVKTGNFHGTGLGKNCLLDEGQARGSRALQAKRQGFHPRIST